MLDTAQPHIIDLIRKKRDGGSLEAREIGFLAAGAADGSIPAEQLSAWLMAAYLRGLSIDETRALTVAMRDSGEKFSPARLGKRAVDKHSTGGVGDKTSFLVAPIAAACGLAVPMISGRALGHTGGTLDKLEAIPGFRTALMLSEFETVLSRCGASIVEPDPGAGSRRPRSVRAARPHGDGGKPGADLRVHPEQEAGRGAGRAGAGCEDGLGGVSAQARGCRVSGRADGGYGRGRRNAHSGAADRYEPAAGAHGRQLDRVDGVRWSCCAASGRRGSEDLRELSLILAGWMIHLGGKADIAGGGYARAEAALADGSALRFSSR